MVDVVALMGAEDVRTAGNKIAGAAEEMSRAASLISEALAQYRVDQERHLVQLQEMLNEFQSDMGVVMGAQ